MKNCLSTLKFDYKYGEGNVIPLQVGGGPEGG